MDPSIDSRLKTPIPTVVVTEGSKIVHGMTFDDLSPLTYRDRAQRFFPLKPEQNVIEHYFVGPTDLAHHSKLPIFIRMHGSIMPQMILPMTFVAVWTTCIWLISSKGFKHLEFHPILLTVTGILIGLALSFRNTTAYERYNEGRRYWSQLGVTSQSLARIIWTHTKERPGEESKKDLLAKITCLQLIVAFPFALKHKLRFEPYVEYDDIRNYVEYLNTFAKEANRGVDVQPQKNSRWKRFGEFLGLPFAESNPRKVIKTAARPLGNLPLEILMHIEGYLDTIVDNGTLKTPVFSTPVVNAITMLNDILGGTERILNTPLPLAYRIVISQITWVYVLALPFQLHTRLNWKMIPATLAAAYIIIGLALIGSQIENPFGYEVNDLPLDAFCEQIAHDIDVISSSPAPKPDTFAENYLNKPLWPLSRSGYPVWALRSEDQIREALRMKVEVRHNHHRIIAETAAARKKKRRNKKKKQTDKKDEIYEALA